MAFQDTTNTFLDRNGNEVNYIYNVSGPVDSGQGQRQDVLLVQYFLANIYSHPTNFQPPLPSPPSDPIIWDGIPGPITGKWIRAFQDYIQSLGLPIVPDGRVDSALPGRQETPIHQAMYTICFLNGDFAIARQDVDFYNIAATDPDCPPELQSLFSPPA